MWRPTNGSISPLLKVMKTEQIAEAQKLSREFVARKEKPN
jgi:hypothetical protein